MSSRSLHFLQSYRIAMNGSGEVYSSIPISAPGTSSGVLMKPTAAEFVPGKVNGAVDEKENAASTFEEESNLVGEDTRLLVTAENRLLAATSFEEMGLDPRFVKALSFLLWFDYD